jgi:methionine salvage enolase-phosphatase E1
MNYATQTKAQYDVYVTDVMGTTTPKSEIGKVTQYILGTPSVMGDIGAKLGCSGDEIRSRIEAGLEASKKGDKDSQAFKDYLAIYDKGSVIGYNKGDITMSLENDVESALQELHDAGSRVMIYSSGAVEATQAGMKSNGLDRLIDSYFSSSQKEIGSKFKADAYNAIARAAGIKDCEMCYITDDVNEAVAAVKAGTGRVYLIDRNAKETGEKDGYYVINDYHQVAEDTTETNNIAESNSGETQNAESAE